MNKWWSFKHAAPLVLLLILFVQNIKWSCSQNACVCFALRPPRGDTLTLTLTHAVVQWRHFLSVGSAALHTLCVLSIFGRHVWLEPPLQSLNNNDIFQSIDRWVDASYTRGRSTETKHCVILFQDVGFSNQVISITWFQTNDSSADSQHIKSSNGWISTGTFIGAKANSNAKNKQYFD